VAEGRTAFPVDPDDFYIEPEWVTGWLLERESFAGPIWDCACGQGSIVRGIHAVSPTAAVVGTDLKDRTGGRSWFLGEADFLTMATGPKAKSIITNPPYGRAGKAESFIRRAIAWPGVEKVAALVNAKFLFSSRRAAGLFKDHPPARIWPIFPRPSCPPGDLLMRGEIKAEGGVENYVWIVWLPGPHVPRFIWSPPVQPL
jgi:hypothetical protein